MVTSLTPLTDWLHKHLLLTCVAWSRDTGNEGFGPGLQADQIHFNVTYAMKR